MLRMGEERDAAKEEAERREDEVEDSREGWREGEEEAARFTSGERVCWGITVEV